VEKALKVTREPRVLPLVLRMREQIDQVFSRYVGPISAELSNEEFDRWLADGQVGPRALNRYILRLSRYIKQASERETFIREASQRMQVLDSGAS
jgi:hypothetical protein